MKTLKYSPIVLLLAVLAIGLNSCEKQRPGAEATGSLELLVGLDDLADAGLKSEDPDTIDAVRYYALLTVIGEDSVPVLEDEMLPMFKFGDGFYTEKIKLKIGHYQLMKFMVVTANGEVIYASPLEGSPKAYLVTDPLPIGFGIEEGATTRLRPEVLPVQGEPPSDFGYSSFGFSIVKPRPFYVIVMVDDPRIMAPVMFTEAILNVYHPDGWQHEFFLEAKVNKVVIRGGAEAYTFVVRVKGYEPKKFRITARELLATGPDSPLVIRVGPLYHVLRWQPGPEEGMDAMISNLEPKENFGKYPFFEATFLSDSILTVMRETRSLIRFSPPALPKSAEITKVTLTLFHARPFPWDSIRPLDTLVYDAFRWYGGVLQQVTDPWQEHEVTWSTQPGTTESNQVFIHALNINSKFIELDITRLYLHPEISAPYFGMMLKLSPEPIWPGFRFASSDFPEPEMRPLLKIHYTLPVD